MKHKSIGLIIGLMTFALLGVMAMQYFFIRQSYLQKVQLFDESVNASLISVAAKAEKQEVIAFAHSQEIKNKAKYEREQRKLQEQLHLQESIDKMRVKLFNIQQEFKEKEEQLLRLYPQATPLDNDFYETYVKNPRYHHLIDIEVKQLHSHIPGNEIRENSIAINATREVPAVKAKDDSTRYLVVYALNMMRRTTNYDIITLPPMTDRYLEREIDKLEKEVALLQANNLSDSLAVFTGKDPTMVESIVAGLELSKRPLNQRVNIDYLKDELRAELHKRDIHAPFNVEIRDDHLVIYNFASIDHVPSSNLDVYTTQLFQADSHNSSPGILSVSFPRKDAILMGSMMAMLALSAALLIVMIGCFAYTIFTILRQKKISEMKTDFINNMTHEFKTPVATIMIASETLKDPDIVADKSRTARLAGIIYDENVRLGNHIERVLNIARLEKDNLKLAHEEVPVHQTIRNAVESMRLQLDKREGNLQLQLLATQDTIIGDELHLSNVFSNLVDNAIKYSEGAPEILIATHSNAHKMTISVTDKGIGMTKDQQAKIFEQFYRVPTGNRHDVKGFGLGLSYVHDIVRRLGGKVSVKSEKGRGTTFEVTLPLKAKEVFANVKAQQLAPN